MFANGQKLVMNADDIQIAINEVVQYLIVLNFILHNLASNY